nr:hypothetical protein [Streptomyces spongiicola]
MVGNAVRHDEYNGAATSDTRGGVEGAGTHGTKDAGDGEHMDEFADRVTPYPHRGTFIEREDKLEPAVLSGA